MRTQLGILFLLAGAVLPGQTRPVFEAASVKPHRADDNQRMLPQFQAGGRFVCKGVPLSAVVGFAYGLGFQTVRLSGGPDWIRGGDVTYDFEAAPAAGALPAGLDSKARLARLQQMLQALLEERFHLKIHSERRDLSLYAVVVGKRGLKLEAAKIAEADCAEPGAGGEAVTCHAINGGRGRGLHGQAVTIADIAAYVENWSDRPMVDQTGLAGLYRVETRGWTEVRSGPAPAPGAKAEDGSDMADIPTLFTVFDGMGLHLDARKGPVDVRVIDSIEKATSN